MFARTRRIGRAAGRVARTFWLALGLAIVLLAGLEALAQVAYFVRQTRQMQALTEAPDRPDQQVAYLREVAAALRLEWEPFTSWKFQPCSGRFVNVDDQGRRRTWAPPHGEPRPVRVFMFGGSTLWGYGARDEHTIASELARLLNRQFPGRVEISNFAVPGYMSAQETVVLQRRLRSGDSPDLVVFYDGFNDALAALVNQRPGVPLWDFHQRLGATARIWRRSGLHQAGRSIARSVLPSAFGDDGPPKDQWESLAARCADEYLRQIRSVEKLGTVYGFESRFFWQPLVYHKLKKSTVERRARDNAVLTVGGYEFLVRADDVERFFLAVDRRVFAGASGGVVDLTGVFRDDGQERFLDACHLTEKANVIIAEKMADVVAPLVRKRLAGERTDRAKN